ncbi:MAG: FAD-linked oxidase C-terminal domain-containing protein, partial [Planctomycetota bacterium]
QRIQDDLRGLISGDVRCDLVFRRMYATDASVFEIEPLGVVRPRSTEDVVATVKYAAEHQIPVHPRGSGSGLAGGCIGPGLVLDFSTYMRRTIDVSEDSVTVQPGVVLARLNHQLARLGRQFGPDASSPAVTTMGGVIAVNRKGSRWLKYGDAASELTAIQLVLPSGDVVNFRRPDVAPEGAKPESLESQIAHRVDSLLETHASTLQANRTHALVNSSGYALHEVQRDGQLNLPRLISGSEGTLGIITQLTVQTTAVPPNRGSLLLLFDRLERAARAALEIRRYEITACDLMDRRLLGLARDSDREVDKLVPKAAEAALLVQCEDDTAVQLGQRLAQLSNLITKRKKLAFASRTAISPIDLDSHMRLHGFVPMLHKLKGARRPVPFVEDIAVHPDDLPAFMVKAQDACKQHEVVASFFAHTSQGQVHMRPFLDLADPEDVRRLQDLAAQLYEDTTALGGTISGEHGDGLSRSWFARQHAPALYPLYREIKSVFDPKSLFNPGKVADTQLHRPTDGLRARVRDEAPATDSAAGHPPVPVQLLLNWQDAPVDAVSASCNGCAACRTQQPDQRMCPIFRFAPSEEASPRAKANLLRGVLNGRVAAEELASDEVKEIADLCVQCYQCREECPTGVDIPKLMLEAKAQYVASNGLRFGDWLLSRLDVVASWAIRFRTLVNFTIANRRTRWLVEKAVGIAKARKLPRLARRPFLLTAQRRKLTRPSRSSGRKVVFFADIYANWFDTPLANALVAILQHNGIAVYVHPKQKQSGMSLISLGAIEKAKRLALRNISLLADAVRQGYQVVTTEPSAALCIRQEYPNLIDDADTQLVAENTFDACSYLWDRHVHGELELDFKPLPYTVGYHLPCHVKAMEQGAPARQLLGLIPGLTVKQIERGCSGMAGTFGLKKSNFRNSLRAGRPLIQAVR